MFFGVCEEEKYQKQAEKYPERYSEYQRWYPAHLPERYEHEEEAPSERAWRETCDDSEEGDSSIRELFTTLFELPTECPIHQKESEREEYDRTSLLDPGE